MSFLPYTADMLTGYFVEGDIYMTFTEYYGDGTVYGLRHVHNPDGSPGYGLGPGLTRADLVARSMIVPEERADAVPIDVSPVPEEGVCAAAEAVAPEAAAPDAVPVEEPKVEKAPTKIVVKLGGISVVLNKVLEKDVSVNVDETAGVVEFVL